MFNRNKLPGYGIFTRLIATFLIVMIPIYLLGILMYHWSLQTVKNEIEESTTAQVAFYLQRLEEEIERMKILQYDCLNDQHLQRLAIRSPVLSYYETVESMLQLQQRLITIKNSSAYILDVSVHIPAIGKTITANTAVNPFNQTHFEQIRVPADMRGAQIILFEDRLFMSTLQQDRYAGNNPLYLIDIELDRQVFEQALEQFNLYDDSASFLAGLSNELVIASQSGEQEFLLESPGGHSSLSGEDGVVYSRVNDRKYYFVYVKSAYLDMVLLRYIPQELVLTPIQNFYIWVWGFSCAALLIIIVFSFSTYRLIHKPLLELVRAFRQVENGDLGASISIDNKNEFGYLYRRFNHMVANLSTLIDQVYKQEILTQRAELKQLQSQINPHFLYNSLFMINTMARIGDDNLIPFTKHLGEYFRFVTKNGEDFIPLQEEVEHSRTYTEIQVMRYSRRLQVHFEQCPREYAQLKVPRLIIQPVVENAFQYAVEKQKNGSVIRISFAPDDEGIRVVVEDNGSGLSEERLAELIGLMKDDDGQAQATGLLNVHRRLRLIYGAKGGLFLEKSELGGMKATLRIGLERECEYVSPVDRG